MWPHPSLKAITKLIAGSINGSNYAAVHVRRGDKVKETKHWPHLDNDTQPERSEGGGEGEREITAKEVEKRR